MIISMENIKILLFYKFIEIENPEEFRKIHLKECEDLGLFGRILVASEGINGSVSGNEMQIEKYKKLLKNDKRFSDITFKEEIGFVHPFTKMTIKIRDEIVALKRKVNLSKRGKHISPTELVELYENSEVGKDFFVVDARNDYEYKVGKFKGAVNPGIKTFRQFPELAKKLEDLKDKKVVMYCTGGIRCEKASAYLIEQGFKDVSQLKDGVINFCQQYPNSLWEGSCFVFDKRLVSNIDENKPITKCSSCEKACDLYKNCRNVNCDELTILCVECQEKLVGCCSEKCLNEFRDWCLEKSARRQNRKVALRMAQ